MKAEGLSGAGSDGWSRLQVPGDQPLLSEETPLAMADLRFAAWFL